jgi:hypothetical protein
MNKIDEILEQLKGQQPVIDDPDALTERIMRSLPDLESEAVEVELPLQQQEHRSKIVPLRRWAAVAASLLLLLGVGTMVWMKHENGTQSAPIVAKVEKPSIAIKDTVAQPVVVEMEPVKEKTPQAAAPVIPKETKAEEVVETSEPNNSLLDEDPNIHYASHELTKDTVPYQAPARIDDFIAELADYHQVKQGELKCSLPVDSSVVSAVYVFPDKKEIDLFGRLLQVACWYDSKTPGYHLNFSQQQFFFELKDMRRQLQYRWIAERINGKILLYSTCAPIDVVVSSACYQEYLDELMHTKSLNSKTLDI